MVHENVYEFGGGAKGGQTMRHEGANREGKSRDPLPSRF